MSYKFFDHGWGETPFPRDRVGRFAHGVAVSVSGSNGWYVFKSGM